MPTLSINTTPDGGVMTEIKAQYQNGVKWCSCSQCGREYGFEVKGGKYLQVGKVRVISMHAECGECGEPIWWYSSDRHIQKISERSVK